MITKRINPSIFYKLFIQKQLLPVEQNELVTRPEENGGVVSHGGPRGVDVVVVQAGIVVSTGPTPTAGPSCEWAPSPSAARERPPNRAPHPLFVSTV